ncbi:2-amino-4-hydroxy-6-hydroxymethyldihydropteridine diphosphokinase [Phycisphaerales bacterium AB-hyl4]|uniref:2-amino-4-hydroxy-6-hydroxymethyldihydropteridine pyrophosphokinase n=1 Tax=Natronomicrosphaera hydrolytica TaxID=3242702 RepID=A0ABV4U503_9BACT
MGSNLGDRWGHLTAACQALAALADTRVAAVSGVYETAPVGGPSGQGAFLNAVVALETTLSPSELLAALQAVERSAGRPSRAERTHWGPRPLDLDVLAYDERVIDEPGLHVPHPRLHERWFVLRPLADVASPAWRHPLTGASVAAMLEAVEADAAARRHAPDALRASAGLGAEDER